jgi:polyribonucleotide nucleotidyltransferase
VSFIHHPSIIHHADPKACWTAGLIMRLVLLLSYAFCSEAFVGNNGRSFKINRAYGSRSSLASTAEEDLSEYFSVSTKFTGPSDGPVHTLTIHKLPGQEEAPEAPAVPEAPAAEETVEPNGDLNGDGEASIDDSLTSIVADIIETETEAAPIFVPEAAIVIETGKIGRQAAGAVTLTRGETVLYATAARDSDPKENVDFIPLAVEHSERFSSAGLTSGSYNRRDGRPAEHEVLTCRLIDRPLRPLIAEGWRHETQLISWVLSYDGQRSCDPLAITASAAALYLSDVPITKPVAAVMVGYHKETGKLILNPTHAQMKTSDLQLIVAGTKDGVMMIEGAADFLPEETMVKAITFGHDAIKVICKAVEAFGKVVGVEKNYSTIKPPVEGLQERVDELMAERVDAIYEMGGTKTTQGPVMSALKKELVATLEEEFPEEKTSIKGAFKDLISRRMFERAKALGVRCDGRKLDEIRRLDMEAGFLPSVHGSALFTRGETQALATATLGGSGMKQKIEKLDGTDQKRFYLQYTFPPSCVGETGRVGMPGRREVGHGNLAERYVFRERGQVSVGRCIPIAR